MLRFFGGRSSRYNSERNPIKDFFDNGNHSGYNPNLFPSIDAFDQPNGNLKLSFRREPSKPAPPLNMLGILSYFGNNKIHAILKPAENFNINHELDYMIEYWHKAQIPLEMTLVKIK